MEKGGPEGRGLNELLRKYSTDSEHRRRIDIQSCSYNAARQATRLSRKVNDFMLDQLDQNPDFELPINENLTFMAGHMLVKLDGEERLFRVFDKKKLPLKTRGLFKKEISLLNLPDQPWYVFVEVDPVDNKPRLTEGHSKKMSYVPLSDAFWDVVNSKNEENSLENKLIDPFVDLEGQVARAIEAVKSKEAAQEPTK